MTINKLEYLHLSHFALTLQKVRGIFLMKWSSEMTPIFPYSTYLLNRIRKHMFFLSQIIFLIHYLGFGIIPKVWFLKNFAGTIHQA